MFSLAHTLCDSANALRRTPRGAASPVSQRTLALRFVAFVVWLLACAPVRAQPGLEDDAARGAFREGTEAAETERWADSERAFARAFALSHAPSALFNQAVALRALGRHVAARRAFDQLLAEFPALDADMRSAAETLRRESSQRIHTLTLVGLSPASHELSLDGEPLADTLERPLRLELDEGAHTLRIECAGHAPYVWRGTTAAAGALHVALAPLPVAPLAREPRRRRWWLGGVVAAVAAGAGTALALALARRDDDQLSPETDRVVEVP